MNLLVDLIEKDGILLAGNVTPSNNEKFQEMINKLNEVPGGNFKDMSEWLRVSYFSKEYLYFKNFHF